MPRDEFLRGMIDTTGIQNRLSLSDATTEDKVREEFEANQFESRMALRFGSEKSSSFPLPSPSLYVECGTSVVIGRVPFYSSSPFFFSARLSRTLCFSRLTCDMSLLVNLL